MSTRAGFIGLGNIGKPMAVHLANSPFDTVVYDINPHACAELQTQGAEIATSPKALAARVDYIGICVRDDADTFAVMQGEEGILAGVKEGTIIAIHSTVKLQTIQALAQLAADKGAHVIDAPITGGAHGAQAKTLCYMAGGDADIIERATPFMLTSGEKIVHAGELCDGMKLKLCNNLMTYYELLAVHEGMKLAKASGLNLNILKEVTTQNGVLTPSMKMFFDTKRGFDEVTFADIMQGFKAVAVKDMASILDLADSLTISLPGAGALREAIKLAYGGS